MSGAMFILYVSDQASSMSFYRQVLKAEPALHVPGMTEFALGAGFSLGLMPEKGIKTLLGKPMPDPARASGIPRAELYLWTSDPEAMYARALAAGGTALSDCQNRDWGDRVGYCLDLDGHVLAFAARCTGSVSSS